jgi:hypothetical protein
MPEGPVMSEPFSPVNSLAVAGGTVRIGVTSSA